MAPLRLALEQQKVPQTRQKGLSADAESHLRQSVVGLHSNAARGITRALFTIAVFPGPGCLGPQARLLRVHLLLSDLRATLPASTTGLDWWTGLNCHWLSPSLLDTGSLLLAPDCRFRQSSEPAGQPLLR